MNQSFNVTIIGAGIVGLATAMKLAAAYPRLRIAVLEKEEAPASHQTGHNSGVIHSGIYYRPGSLKAQMCISGARQLVRFCEENDIPYELCGKIVVAVRAEEVPRLRLLHQRGVANGAPGLQLLGPDRVREIEPHVACLEALLVPTTGIVSFRQVAEAYAKTFQNHGGRLFPGQRVTAIKGGKGGIHIETSRGVITTESLINCAGLYSDRVAELAGVNPPCRIIPFRGEYYKLKSERAHLIKNLIYPVPDPRFPFLGVHFTRMIDHKVEAGPNAVLAWSREGYKKTDVVWSELLETLGYSGFRRMALRYWAPGLQEMLRSYSKRRFVGALQRLVPDVRDDDLMPGGAGVRAQALRKDGSLLDDFVILRSGKTVHVLNAPSPAATSALAIGEYILNAASPLFEN
jgi:L-2-hydroxyglutarate oxidase LhgO